MYCDKYGDGTNVHIHPISSLVFLILNQYVNENSTSNERNYLLNKLSRFRVFKKWNRV